MNLDEQIEFLKKMLLNSTNWVEVVNLSQAILNLVNAQATYNNNPL